MFNSTAMKRAAKISSIQSEMETASARLNKLNAYKQIASLPRKLNLLIELVRTNYSAAESLAMECASIPLIRGIYSSYDDERLGEIIANEAEALDPYYRNDPALSFLRMARNGDLSILSSNINLEQSLFSEERAKWFRK